MAKTNQEIEKEIIDLLRGVKDVPILYYFYLVINANINVDDVQKYLINKIYVRDYITPWFVKNLKQFSEKKYLLPYFIKNKETFQITGIYDENGKIITEIPNDSINNPKAKYKFKYGSDPTEYDMYEQTTFQISNQRGINDSKNDLWDIDYADSFPPAWYGFLKITDKNSKSYTFNDFYEEIGKGIVILFLISAGADLSIVENVDYEIREVRIRRENDNIEIPGNWLQSNFEEVIWQNDKIITNPFSKPCIQFVLQINGLANKNNSAHIARSNYVKFTLFQKIDISKINWPELEFSAEKPYDTYQKVIDFINPFFDPFFEKEAKKFQQENSWIWDENYPEFDWEFGAFFLDSPRSDIKNFDIKNDIADPNAEITNDNIVNWTIKAKENHTTFQGEIILPVKVNAFVKYQLEEVAFATYNYQAITVKDTYKDALNAIKNEIRELLVRNFNEPRITNIDFELSTENEDSIINQDKTIKVTIKATNDSKWLDGENKFDLNVKQFITFKPFRQFKLINNLQQEIDLQNLNLILGSNPNDLGINYKNNFLQIENDFIFTQKNSNLNNINFTLTFLAPNAYDKYYQFINFLIPNININQPLTLRYQIHYENKEINKNNYYCEVFFKGITKTELNNLKNLETQINFEKVSNWKNLVTKQLEFESNTLELENNGQLPAPIIIQIFGSSVNPYFILKNENDQILAESKINYTVESSNVLTIDSKVTEQKIVILKDNKEINIFDYQDFTKETFIFIPPGKSTLSYQNKKGSERIYVSIEEQYLSI